MSRMAWIPPIQMNMDISQNIYEGKPTYTLIALVQKIAIYTIFPLLLVASIEAVVKNLILINLANCGIVLLNAIHSGYHAYFGN